jgi:hypothetical protein
MPAIGIDTHKRTLAACAVDDVGGVIDERTPISTRGTATSSLARPSRTHRP